MNEFTPIELTQKLLLDKITLQEKEKLDNWINSSQENKELFDEYKKVWEVSEGYQKSYTPDVEAGWNKFQQRIAKETVKPTTKVRSMTPWYRAAAAILLLVGAGLVWNQFSTPTAQMVKVTTSSEESKIITLADGSTVHLNENSVLMYPKTFSGDTRQVTMSGEAFFNVARDTEHPFLIEGNQTEIKVLGTSFNVKNYPSDKQAEVVVSTGKVQFSGKTKNQSSFKFVTLEKDDHGIYERASSKLVKAQVASRNFDSWKTKSLHFEDTPMSIVIDDIQDFYNVEIDKSKTKVLDCTYTSTFNNNSIEEVFDNLELGLGLKVETKSDRSYELIGGRKCN